MKREGDLNIPTDGFVLIDGPYAHFSRKPGKVGMGQ
jgi:hypothetical protein